MTTRFTFDCPHCQATTIVDEGMRDLLLEDGCILCETTVSMAAFDRTT
ncbi:hypothetical protein VB773_12950 [Haloarculaceae archaeon H-GB2-1]|nr:hypothetical protein [Haloarculaceae archaeon H-GB1-1]MEA5386898.1 hypothetical protein [Haloarculaceae archaeon H-GB11]MEA5408379.1 hypothetical protein [Haloarculaceae archaeon H-GB2-1]